MVNCALRAQIKRQGYELILRGEQTEYKANRYELAGVDRKVGQEYEHREYVKVVVLADVMFPIDIGVDFVRH